MNSFNQYKKALDQKGFVITEPIFSDEELQKLISLTDNSEKNYAVRQLVNKVPKLQELLFKNKQFKSLFAIMCSEDYFLSKSIFFNKPSKSNWFVSHHQDLSISVNKRIDIDGYESWTNKNGQFGVIPPVEILENTVTIRIHLDKTDATNGALRVIPSSHKKGIIRIDKTFDKNHYGQEVVCKVKKGGIMLMKPLILHASSKSIAEFDRRVIHLEFCNKEIPMKWLERREILKYKQELTN